MKRRARVAEMTCSTRPGRVDDRWESGADAGILKNVQKIAILYWYRRDREDMSSLRKSTPTILQPLKGVSGRERVMGKVEVEVEVEV